MTFIRPYRELRDEAVSPVIAVILMVAITVVLAATVYVWVSGFGSSGSQAKNASFSITSSGGVNTLTVVSISPNTLWNNLKLVVSGPTTYGILVKGQSCSSFINSAAWDGSLHLSSTSCTVNPGDEVIFGTAAAASTATISVVDRSANTVISSLTPQALTGYGSTAAVASTCAVTGTHTVTLSKAVYPVATTSTTNAQVPAAALVPSAHAIGTPSNAITSAIVTLSGDTLAGGDTVHLTTAVYDIGGTAAAVTVSSACA